MAINGLIKNIEEMAAHDGPGYRCIVFLKGCPLKCTWCQNPELINPHPEKWYRKTACAECGLCVENCIQGAITLDKDNKFDPEKCVSCFKCVEICPNKCFEIIGSIMTSEQVVNHVERFRQFFEGGGGGITLSGGEPLFQAEFTADVLRRSKEISIHTAMESCLFATSETLLKVIKYLDVLMCDIKHMDSAKHKAGTGVPNEQILENYKVLNREYQGEIVVRIPLIPGFNDDPENIRKTAEFLYPLEKVKGIDLLPFNALPIAKFEALCRHWVHKGDQRQPDEHSEELKAIVDSFGRFNTTIGGLW